MTGKTEREGSSTDEEGDKERRRMLLSREGVKRKLEFMDEG